MVYRQQRFAGRGKVYGDCGTAPTITAHYGKNVDEGLVKR